MDRPTRVVPELHARPAEGEANELLGFERALFWLRLVGLGVVISQAPLYRLLSPALVVLGVLVVAGTAAAQRLVLRDGLPLPVMRRRAILLLACDLVAMFVVGTAFTPDRDWLGYFFYPLMSLEATLIAGMLAGLTVTGLSLVVYGAQLVLHVSLGNDVSARAAIGALALIGMVGGFVSIFGRLAERGRRDLRVLLELASALAQQRDEVETIQLLDRRLHDSMGGRVRSILVRGPGGQLDVVRWPSPAHGHLVREDLEAALGPMAELTAAMASGASLTYQTDAWSLVTSALGLPEWARAVTFVPIVNDGRWIGILPVLWPTARTPTAPELRLLNGLAGHVGLALAQGEVQRAREEAATDPLTRLLNRRAVSDELAAYLARAARSGGRVGVLFCDLDGFKAVNDTRGHEAGDLVLERVAGAVREALRAGDVVGRYGGDELLVVAADAGPDEAVALGRRIRDAVLGAAGPDGVDVTIGIAIYPTDGTSDGDLLVAADQAMYRGKLRGPGNVMLAADAEPRAEAIPG